jgi:glutamate-1-semialdehyde 2,1-aminomutase
LTTLQTLNNDPAIFDRLAEKTVLHKGIECFKARMWSHTINRIGSMDFSSFDATPVMILNRLQMEIMIHSKILLIVARRNLYCAIRFMKVGFITDALSYEDLDFNDLS